MSAISNIGTMFATATSGLKSPAAWLMQALGISANSAAGIPVTYRTILGIPEVNMAIQKITGHIAQMEVECRQLVSDGGTVTTKVVGDPGAVAFSSGSQFFNRFTVMEKLMFDALVHGNGRLYIERNARGVPVALYPIQAANAQTVIHDGERYHVVTLNTGTEVGPLKDRELSNGQMYVLEDKEVFYVMGLSSNGLWGDSPIDLLKDAFGLAIAGQEASGSMFRNAGRPGLILEAPRGAFKAEKDRQEFMDGFNKAHRGLDKAGKTALIHSGMTAHVLPNDTNNSGYVEQRQFQREGMAMIFLLESVFGDNTGSTYKSVTERNSAYLTNCLGRWIGKIEAEADKKMLSPQQRITGRYKYKLNTSVLYVHDKISLAEYTSKLRQQQAVSGNDVREMHGLQPVDDLKDDYHAVGGKPEAEEKPEASESEGDDSNAVQK